jgi:cytochrome P450
MAAPRTRSAVAALQDVDLALPQTHLRADIDDIFRRLRTETPVARHSPVDGRPGFWVVSTHALATEVYRAERFSSARGNVLTTLLHGGDSAGGRMLAVSDGDRHRQIRRRLLQSFSPAALEQTRQRIGRSMRGLIREAASRDVCDFATEVAPQVPLAAICDMLDIPIADRNRVFASASRALAGHNEDDGEMHARVARSELLRYFSELVASRGDAPAGEDLIAQLIHMSRPPLRLTAEEIIFNCYSLLLGGDETTRLALIGTVKAFAEHPESWRRLLCGEIAVDTAVEELLRWTTPALHAGRTAVTDTVLGGTVIAAGDVVTVWNRSANFDEAEFDRPGELNLARTPNRHLSFAYGPHFCLGAILARMEVAMLLEALREEVSAIEVAGPPSPMYSNFLSGFHQLPVRLTPRRTATTS